VCLGFVARFALPALAVVVVRGFVTPAAAQLTERVSVDSSGAQGNRGSGEPALKPKVDRIRVIRR